MLLTNWSTRCLHVPPPGGWRVVGGAHGPGVVQGLAQHVEPAIIVQHEVFEDYWSNGQLSLAGSHQVLDVRVHHGEPGALRVVAVLHGDENVASRTNNTQHLREGRGVDLARSKSIAADDDIVGLVGDWDRAEPVNSRVDVVLVNAQLPGLAQHAKGLVQAVDVDVALASQFAAKQTCASSHVQNLHLKDCQ